jgi:hypothetical protein
LEGLNQKPLKHGGREEAEEYGRQEWRLTTLAPTLLGPSRGSWGNTLGFPRNTGGIREEAKRIAKGRKKLGAKLRFLCPSVFERNSLVDC